MQAQFELRPFFTHITHMEVLWDDCEEDCEVRKIWWCRFTLKQTKEFKLHMNFKGVEED